MAKRALLIGCNYSGTKAELHGCVNDVSRMYKSLVERFGFVSSDITVMVDTDKRSVQPTGAQIRKVLGRLIDESQPGDFLVMHYSGHGTQVPAESGDKEDDGLDEAIVPTDLNLLTDDDFRVIFKNIQPGVYFTFISDSCHSGGLIDAEKEQIGGGPGMATKAFQLPVAAGSRGYGGGTRSYGGAESYESESYKQGRREESEYEREREGYGEREEFGRHKVRREEEEFERERGRHQGRREEPEYEREEYGRHQGRREEPVYEREEYGRHQGRREESEYEREERGRHQGRREEYEEEPRRQLEYGHPQEGYGQGRKIPSASKSLSLDTLTQMLSEQAGHEVKPGNIKTTLYSLFGEDASPTIKVFVNVIANRLQGGDSNSDQFGGGWLGTIGGLAMDFMKAKLSDSDSGVTAPDPVDDDTVPQTGHAGAKPPPERRLSPDIGILVSGCQSDETSADANPTGNPAQAYGALSNSIQTVLAEKSGPISNGELVTEVRALLKKQGFSQHPCLYCSDRNVNTIFICE